MPITRTSIQRAQQINRRQPLSTDFDRLTREPADREQITAALTAARRPLSATALAGQLDHALRRPTLYDLALAQSLAEAIAVYFDQRGSSRPQAAAAALAQGLAHGLARASRVSDEQTRTVVHARSEALKAACFDIAQKGEDTGEATSIALAAFAIDAIIRLSPNSNDQDSSAERRHGDSDREPAWRATDPVTADPTGAADELGGADPRSVRAEMRHSKEGGGSTVDNVEISVREKVNREHIAELQQEAEQLLRIASLMLHAGVWDHDEPRRGRVERDLRYLREELWDDLDDDRLDGAVTQIVGRIERYVVSADDPGVPAKEVAGVLAQSLEFADGSESDTERVMNAVDVVARAIDWSAVRAAAGADGADVSMLDDAEEHPRRTIARLLDWVGEKSDQTVSLVDAHSGPMRNLGGVGAFIGAPLGWLTVGLLSGFETTAVAVGGTMGAGVGGAIAVVIRLSLAMLRARYGPRSPQVVQTSSD